jgi:two-component system chemotaxis response regulator CheY
MLRDTDVGPTVLLCDDAMFVRILLAGLVAREGYEVVGEAGSGEEAVRQVARLQPDIVIMDLVLPGMNGIEATRRIREIAHRTRIVICSGLVQKALIAEALAAGAAAFLAKPPTREQIRRTLAALPASP